MQFFLDTADLDEIRTGLELGMVDGVTTNPTLVSRAGKEFEELVKEICSMVPGPVSVEAVSERADDLVAEGERLASWAENVVVKIPMTEEGMKATRRLSGQGIRVNVTLIFSPTQALLAAKAGATYASLFVGRSDDISTSSRDLVQAVVDIYRNYAFSTQVLVASVRHPMHVLDAALAGAEVVTMPLSVLRQLYVHPLTAAGLARFREDWEKLMAQRAHAAQR